MVHSRIAGRSWYAATRVGDAEGLRLHIPVQPVTPAQNVEVLRKASDKAARQTVSRMNIHLFRGRARPVSTPCPSLRRRSLWLHQPRRWERPRCSM